MVHPADIADGDGARRLVADVPRRYPQLTHVWADAAYRSGFRQWASTTLGIAVETVQRSPASQRAARGTAPPSRARFQVLPRRWVVERTFAWLGRFRRMSRDYEALPDTQRAMVHLCMIRLMLQRLAAS